MAEDSRARNRALGHLLWPLLAIAVVMPPGGVWMEGRMAIPKAALAIVLLAWAWSNRARPSRLFAADLRWIPVSLSVLAILAFTAVGILAVANFSNFDWGDISYYLSSFRNSTGLLPGTNVISGRPFLAHHSEFLCIPVGWIFRLAPGPLILQLIQAAAALSAWALFRAWLLKRSSDRMTAEWIAFGFALSPCILAPLLKGFHAVALVSPILVLTATSFHDRKWNRFLGALAVLLLTKEIFILTAFSLGAVALIQRRELKWILVPMAMGLLYGLFLRFLFFPWMLGDQVYFYASNLGGPGEILQRLLSWKSFLYLLMLLLWGGTWRVLGSPLALLAVPPALLNLSLDGAFGDPHLHYIVEPSFWIYFAGAVALLGRNPSAAAVPEPVPEHVQPTSDRLQLAAFLACLLLMNQITRENMPLYLRHPYQASYEKALSIIPEDATVSLGAALEDHLWKVKRYFWVKFGDEHWLEHDSEHYCREGEYAVMLKVHIPGGSDGFDWEEQQRIWRCKELLEKDPGYETLWQDSALIVFRKKGPNTEIP